jgi:multidrug resistance efflux pump
LDAHARFEKPQQLKSFEKAVADARSGFGVATELVAGYQAKAEAEKSAAEKKMAGARAALSEKLDQIGKAVLPAPADGMFRAQQAGGFAPGMAVSQGAPVGTVVVP